MAKATNSRDGVKRISFKIEHRLTKEDMAGILVYYGLRYDKPFPKSKKEATEIIKGGIHDQGFNYHAYTIHDEGKVTEDAQFPEALKLVEKWFGFEEEK